MAIFHHLTGPRQISAPLAPPVSSFGAKSVDKPLNFLGSGPRANSQQQQNAVARSRLKCQGKQHYTVICEYISGEWQPESWRIFGGKRACRCIVVDAQPIPPENTKRMPTIATLYMPPTNKKKRPTPFANHHHHPMSKPLRSLSRRLLGVCSNLF